ncbi:hypothetical protein LU699_17885 [Luteimonas fraxinea]|uniref:Uncharacterized protein n=1 Tax=Luteimonas fraxinea TaxID=2901869 RepID=A0ABS8UCK6_9GAMM|nr:hypothetical protein [Luteimonas fraxinea]MCD9096461.1 hypothetical protein [Luteimonas fraxinea]MCD9125802.1 hypothetical protein [Luteimonas fraxinea]UHH10097.1 hypothetical protein LU699_17885 [Luteimonas fraxinea]
MSPREERAAPSVARRVRRPWRWIALGGVVCVLAWVALGIGLVAGVDRTARLVLVTVAAVATEGLVWLSAALLGLRVFEARRQLWQTLRARVLR